MSDDAEGGAEILDLDEERIFRAFTRLHKRLAKGASYDELCAGYEALREQFFPLRETKPELFRTIQRRVAEDLLRAAQLHEHPIEQCEKLLEEVIAMGWGPLKEKFLVLFPFGRYCLDHRALELGLRHLMPLRRELREEWKKTNVVWSLKCLRQINGMIREYKAAS